MPKDLAAILKLEVPVIVRLGERQMSLREVIDLVPGSIIELPKNAEDELDLLVNNKQVACGHAVKVGENFGLQVTYVGDMQTRVKAMAPERSNAKEEENLLSIADQMLAGQT